MVNFLTSLFKQGLQYSTINTARSALSSTLPPVGGLPVGQHYLVCRLMRGIFVKKPKIVALFPDWSIGIVLETIKSWGPNHSLDLKLLSYKTVFLLALCCAKRPSSISLFSVDPAAFQCNDDFLRLVPVGLEKHTRPGYSQKPVIIHSFTENLLLDPVKTIQSYVRRTQSIRQSNSLFVKLTSPHDKVATVTLSRWISSVIRLSGQAGSGGSTRSTSSSAAFSKGMSLDAVLEAGNWSRASTFQRFYFKPCNESTLSDIVLNS